MAAARTSLSSPPLPPSILEWPESGETGAGGRCGAGDEKEPQA